MEELINKLSEEEKKAIEILDTFTLRMKTKNYNKIDYGDIKAIKTVLNIIKKQQEQLQEKDKIIYEMAKEIQLWRLDNACTEKVASINEIIERFTKKSREV